MIFLTMAIVADTTRDFKSSRDWLKCRGSAAVESSAVSVGKAPVLLHSTDTFVAPCLATNSWAQVTGLR